jgi:hypothetical protein
MVNLMDALCTLTDEQTDQFINTEETQHEKL